MLGKRSRANNIRQLMVIFAIVMSAIIVRCIASKQANILAISTLIPQIDHDHYLYTRPLDDL